jgi:class 3 adenylate cyclase
MYTVAEAVACHQEVLRRRIREHGGCEVRQGWDMLVAAFPSAGDALRAAAAALRALAPEPPGPWGPSVSLPMRAALHSGDVELQDGDYRGPALDHGARVLSAGHAWQIVCSEAAARLLRSDLDPGARLVDLGEFRLYENPTSSTAYLRPLPAPERLFQVEYPEMPVREFPPPNALAE